ncbi:hypothetical protein Vretifemale_18925 [Volvox reticuliferus]|uniref:Dynein assembly factor 1, axonemal homolog n=3 Tax=Volvox reticuliferus TaxID=1737510 RepID=A0A8J4D3Q6_9CHLO|nr:hypothetical protein Vretifemale_18925 [Volvox reticuliferus]
MGFQLTPESLRKLCKDLKLYTSCPELNDVLHLQCKGITKLENLDAYTGLKTLYLEQNAISEIENLDKLVNLRCLYLGKNMISSTLGLQALTNLETLDLAENVITTIVDLSKLPLLKTLNISGNRLHTVDDIRDLAACPQLQSLDMTSNRLEAPEVIDFVMTMPLLYLRLMGNPAVSNYKHYRKTLLARIPTLNYLDDSPVFPKDRRLAVAFIEGGGLEAERATRELIRREEEEIREAHRRAFDEMVERARQQPPEPHDPMRFRAVPPGESESDEEGLPALYRRRNRASSANNAAAATAGSLAKPQTGSASDGAAAVGSSAETGGNGSGHGNVPVVANGVPAGGGLLAAAGLETSSSAAASAAAAVTNSSQTGSGNGLVAEVVIGATVAAGQPDASVEAAGGRSVAAGQTQPTHGSLIVRLEEELRDLAASASTSASPGGGDEAAGGVNALLHASLARLHAGVSNMSSPAQLQQLRGNQQHLLQPSSGDAGAGVGAQPALARPDFREELRGRAIARAAARAELASVMSAGAGSDAALSSSATLVAAPLPAGAANAGPASVRGSSHPPRVSRPVWRTPDYQRLWSLALQVGEAQEQQHHQEQEHEQASRLPQELRNEDGPEAEAEEALATAPSATSDGLLLMQAPQLVRYVPPAGSDDSTAGVVGEERIGGEQNSEAGAAPPPLAMASLDLLSAPEALTPDEALSIADSAMGYDRIQRGLGGGGGGGLMHGGRDADLDSARSRGGRESDLDLRVAEVDLDSARGTLMRPGALGDIDSARSYSRPASSRGDFEEMEEDGVGGDERDPAGGAIEAEDIDLELLAAAAAAGAAQTEPQDLFERYSVTAYGRGDTSHLRQRRNSGGDGNRHWVPLGAGVAAAIAPAAGSPLRRSSASADHQVAERGGPSSSGGDGTEVQDAVATATATAAPTAVGVGMGAAGAGLASLGPDCTGLDGDVAPAAGPAAAVAAATSGGGSDSNFADRPQEAAAVGPPPSSPSYLRRTRELPPHIHPQGHGHGQGHGHWSLRRTDTANSRTLESSRDVGDGNDGNDISSDAHQMLRQYDSDVELATAGPGGYFVGGGGAVEYDSDGDGDDEVVADPAELLQRARSILTAEGSGHSAAGGGSGGPGSGGAGLASPADIYHQLAGAQPRKTNITHCPHLINIPRCS